MEATRNRQHSNKTGIFTVSDAVDYGVELLEKGGVDEARANVEIFLSDMLDCKRIELRRMGDKVMQGNELDMYNNFLERRLIGEPLQYIMGSVNFYGYDIKVNPSVLIPRPETELLVEKVPEDIRQSGKNDVNIVEAGTGSGCIAVALGKELQKMEINYHITAYDISQEAVDTALENLVYNHLIDGRIEIKTGNVLDLVIVNKDTDYLVSNPPYVSQDEYSELSKEILEHEPECALTDNGDGMTFYRKFIDQSKEMKSGSKIFCEIGFGQKDELERLLKEEGIREYSFYKDLNGIDRIMEVTV
ncbi:MAG: peptide chain release factor N(5)-glutamine methyltransferase [Ignavibacteriae bacterium]|nr:peptide chain release factor N(5)-glutamine methyltransferase [Ignavibacteriota bacterium]